MDEEKKAGDQEGMQRLSIDGFRFASFPTTWPENDGKRKTQNEVHLTGDRIRELRSFIELSSANRSVAVIGHKNCGAVIGNINPGTSIST